MESLSDNVADSGEPIDKENRGSGDRRSTESLYGPGVPTAESFADDVPPEWLHEEDGSSPELRNGLAG